MNYLNRFITGIVVSFSVLTLVTACGNQATKTADSPITVVSREEGSGTRGAFIELFGIEQKTDDGQKLDHTSNQAIITNSTAVMLTTVAGDKSAIGYASLGALDGSSKVLKVDGVEATVETIKSGSYKIARPFNIVSKEKLNEASQDFVAFILSKEGQAVVEEAGYISVESKGAYKSTVQSGKVVISGSSSVSPVMEKLKEAYQQLNSGVEVQIQQSDSSTGVASTIDGSADIGMASRDLKDSEEQSGVKATVIAIDGIAVIVNQENPLQGLSSQQIQDIFTGQEVQWSAYLSE